MRELRFADFRIDLNQMQLYHDGTAVSIGRKTLDTLLYLIENRSRIVSQQELHRAIWDTEPISPSTIPMCISEIRKSLIEDAKNPRLISSMKGLGYRFIGTVTQHNDEDSWSHTLPEPPFIGRAGPIARLQAALRQTRSDLQGRTISIVGEAGVGKTRLLREFLTTSPRLFDYIIAYSDPSNPHAAYSIWKSAIQQALQRFPNNKPLQECAGQIASVLPELSAPTTRSTTPPKISQSIFHALWSNAFRSITKQRPLIIALDDFHQANDDSVSLFQHLTTELAASPILLITLTRPSLPTHRKHHITKTATTSPNHIHIPLQPFTPEEVRHFIDPYRDDRDTFASEIFDQTAGNAFYVIHILQNRRAPLSTNKSTTDSDLGILDAKDIVSRQLSDLPDQTRRALTIASALGQSFTAEALAHVTNDTAYNILTILEPALEARIIRPDGRSISFCHSILREALYRSLGTRPLQEMHAHIARSLRDLAPDSPEKLFQLFHHLARSYPTTSAEEVASVGLIAGTNAISRLSFWEAAAILDECISLMSRDASVSTILRLEIPLHRARAMHYLGEHTQARTLILETARLARVLMSPKHLALCALALVPDFQSLEVGSHDPVEEMLLREALALLPADDSSMRARVLARTSQTCRWNWPHSNEAEALAEAAHHLAIDSGDPTAMAAALEARADAAHGPDRTDQRVSHVLSLERLKLREYDPYSFLLQQTRLISALLEAGEIRQLQIANNRNRSIADRLGLPHFRWYPLAIDSMLMCLKGDLSAADQIAAQYQDLAGRVSDENFSQTYACQAALRAIERNLSAQATDLIVNFARSKPAVLSWAAAAAWIQWSAGQHHAARESLRQFTPSDIERLYREPGGTIGLAALSEVCAGLGAQNQARQLLDLIAPVAQRFATAGYGVVYFGSMARYAGHLALALGHEFKARELFSMAVSQERRVGSTSWLAYALIDELTARIGPKPSPSSIPSGRHKQLSVLLKADIPRVRHKIHEAFGLGLSEVLAVAGDKSPRPEIEPR